MKLRLYLLFSISLASVFADDKKAEKTVMVKDLPFDAIEVRSDVYRRIENGKPMIYVRSPLGLTRVEQTEEMRHVLDDGPPQGIRVKETATEFFFERDTPFGTPKWSKKKNSLEKADKLIPEEQESIDYHRKLLEKLKPAEKPKKEAKKEAKK